MRAPVGAKILRTGKKSLGCQKSAETTKGANTPPPSAVAWGGVASDEGAAPRQSCCPGACVGGLQPFPAPSGPDNGDEAPEERRSLHCPVDENLEYLTIRRWGIWLAKTGTTPGRSCQGASCRRRRPYIPTPTDPTCVNTNTTELKHNINCKQRKELETDDFNSACKACWQD